MDEWVAELPYRPTACKHTYRMVVVRKNLTVSEPRQGRLFEDYRYFFYITNEGSRRRPPRSCSRPTTAASRRTCWPSSTRCGRLHAPVDNLLSNWAYMLMTTLAWNLKAWLALWLPARAGRWHEQHQAQQQPLLSWSSARSSTAGCGFPVRCCRRVATRAAAAGVERLATSVLPIGGATGPAAC